MGLPEVWQWARTTPLMRMTRGIMILCFALAVVGCQRETQVQRANREKILLVSNGGDPKSLDLQLVTGVIEAKVIGSLFEGLVADSPDSDTKMLPGAAEKWEHNADFTAWTFHLRKGATWSDGVDLTAHDFIFAYHRMLHPDLAAPYVEMLYFLKNAKEYNQNMRCQLLARAGVVNGVTAEMAATVNAAGDAAIDIADLGKSPDWKKLSAEERKRYVANKGLDKLERPALRWILEDPGNRFPWPEAFADESRRALLTVLAGKAGDSSISPPAPAVDLFELADIGVRVEDDYTLQFTLKEPVPYLPDVTRHYTWFPIPKHVVLSYGGICDRANPWTEEGKIVGNGAFVLKSWRLNDYILVTKNPRYWDAANVQINGVKFLPIENFYTETRAFLAGQVHTTYQIPPDLIPKMKAEFPQYLRMEPYVGSRFMRMNVTRPGLDNVKVRQAMSLAIDRKTLCDTVLLGFAPTTSLSPNMGDYKPAPVLSFDPEKARALLAEAGYPGGKGFPRYAILMSSGGTRATTEAIQAMWKQNLNILVDIKAMDWGSYTSAQQKLEFDISIAGWSGDYLDPTTFLLMWTKGNGNNNTGWSSETFEKMLDEAAHNPDTAERLRIFEKAEKLLMDEQPIMPFAWQARNYLHDPGVKGWHALLLDNHPWSAVRFESDAPPP